MRKNLGLAVVVVGLALFASGANAADYYTEQYEMNASPATLAGTANGNVLFLLPDAGTGTNGPSGFVFAGGIGTFLDDGNSSGNQGLYTGGSAPGNSWINANAAYTADFRIRVLQDVAGSGDKKSMSFWSTNGRGLQLNLGTSTFVNGSGPAGTGGTGTFSNWTQCRVIVNGTTNTADFYVGDTACPPNWTLNATTSMGGSGFYGGSTVGFALGSTAGSHTTLCNYDMDYFRVKSGGTTVTAVYDLKPEPCGTLVAPAAAQTVSGYAGGLPVSFASVALGVTDVSNGLTAISVGDGTTAPASIGGRECRKNATPGANDYVYCALSVPLPSPSVTISFDYFDVGTGDFGLNYDGVSDPWSGAATVVTRTNTLTWKRGSFAITDANFAKRENYGGDFRIGGGGTQFYIANVYVAVTGNHGPDLTYTLTNSGGSVIDNWDVVEANADGSLASHPWLILTKTPAAGTDLAAGTACTAPGSASIKAVFDTSALTTSQTTYLKFTDDCPLPASYTEPFDYTTGAPCLAVVPDLASDPCLTDQVGWTTGGAGHSEFTVRTDTHELRVNGSNGGGTDSATHSTGLGNKEGVIEVTVKIKQGTVAAGHDTTANFWAFRALDGAGATYGYWTGSPTTFRARNPVNANDASAEQTMTTGYETLKMTIYTGAQTTKYSIDSGSGFTDVFTTPCNATGGVDKIAFEVNSNALSGTDYVYFDDPTVAVTAQYKLRPINLNILAYEDSVTPTAVTLINNVCAGANPTAEFAVINNGTYDITGLTVAPVGGVFPAWLTSVSTTAMPIGFGGAGTVTANIDWTKVLPLDAPQSVTLRFTAMWGALIHNIDAVLTVTSVSKLAPEASQWVVYSGDKYPADPNSGGTGINFTLRDGTTDQQATPVSYDDPSALAPSIGRDGKAYHLLDTLDTGKTKWGSLPVPTMDGTRGVTLAGRMKVLADNNNADMSDDGNLTIYAQGFTVHVHYSGAAGGHLTVCDSGYSKDVAADENYHIIRITARVEGTNHVVNVYFDEDPTPVIHIPNMPARTDDPNNAGNAFGFGQPRSVHTQDIYFDWVAAMAHGAFAPGEEKLCYGKNIWDPSLWPAYCGETTRAGATRVFADADDDGDVDMDDFAILQTCYTIGAGYSGTDVPSDPVWCKCLDHGRADVNGSPEPDKKIDPLDLKAFTDCCLGPAVQWTQALAPNCKP